MQRLKCAICGSEFEVPGGNAKYCSEKCRKDGQRMRRQEWESRTGYKEKQRQAAAEHRVELARIAEQEAKEASRKRKSAETKARRKKERKQTAELEAKAAEGDKLASMKLALKQGNLLEYWRLYKEIFMGENVRLNMVGKNTVGGIDIYDDAFEYKVVELLKEQRENQKTQGNTETVRESGEYYDE